jgi:uncharacterized damage-inducible protein DinB
MRTGEMGLLIAFNRWVNHRLLDTAEALTDDQFRDPASPTNLGLRASLVHMLDIEWSWRLLISSRKGEDTGVLSPDDFPTLTELRRRWAQDEAEMDAWFAMLTDTELDANVAPEGSTRHLPRWQFLMHVLMHSRQLQGDVATILSTLGHSPGDIDFLVFLGERQAAP